MLKYIIAWVVVSMQPTSCPDADTASEFGLKRNPYMSCAVSHFRTIETPHSKTFFSKDSARAFYNRAKGLESSDFSSEGVQKVSIDSIKIK